jgi:ferritin-like metal-binding protein YciE
VNQVDRVERIFEALGEKPTGKKCAANDRGDQRRK